MQERPTRSGVGATGGLMTGMVSNPTQMEGGQLPDDSRWVRPNNAAKETSIQTINRMLDEGLKSLDDLTVRLEQFADRLEPAPPTQELGRGEKEPPFTGDLGGTRLRCGAIAGRLNYLNSICARFDRIA